MSGKVEKAIDEFKELDRDRSFSAILCVSGSLVPPPGTLRRGRKYFQEGLKLDPRNASCLFNMGYIEGRQGNQAAAEAIISAGTEIQSGLFRSPAGAGQPAHRRQEV